MNKNLFDIITVVGLGMIIMFLYGIIVERFFYEINILVFLIVGSVFTLIYMIITYFKEVKKE